MAFRRGRPLPIWGWAARGEKGSVALGGQQGAATGDADGKGTRIGALSLIPVE